MRKVFALFIALTLVITLSGCTREPNVNEGITINEFDDTNYYTSAEVDLMLEEMYTELLGEMVIESDGHLYNDCSTSDDVRVCHRIYLNED